ECGAVADTLERARHYGQRAITALGRFPDGRAKSALIEAAEFAVSRAYWSSARAVYADRVTDLPIHAVLPDPLAALRAGSAAVLVAPPGAGKTTAVAPALLGEPWCVGEVLLLSPRRLAARAAAERVAGA